VTANASVWPVKAPVVDLPVSCTRYPDVLAAIERRPEDRATVVAVCNVHSVMTARRDHRVAGALRAADIATPDGMPLVWMLRRTAAPEQERVYGPDLMRQALVHGVQRRWRHYFLGTTPETLARLTVAAERLAPGVSIVGTSAPPYRTLTTDEHAAIYADVLQSGADLVWVGLGMPKQELWMEQAKPHLPGVALVGVGAAFDFLAGTVPQAPAWMQCVGLEWLYRFSREPRRLWRRYLLNNPAFVFLAMRQLIARSGRAAASHLDPTPRGG
jgi:N-acetylglucosaminyldiphosphoundecaprenol N-acetyl-beta-D-mannosaminyltransferase